MNIEEIKFKIAWYEWLTHIVEKHWIQECPYTDPKNCWKLLPHGDLLLKI